MSRRRINPRDVERAREYIEGRGLDCAGLTDQQIIEWRDGLMSGSASWEGNEKRIADRIDGYDRDDLGESPDW